MPCLIPPWTDMPKFEYAPAPESRAIVSIKESYGLFIDGRVHARRGRRRVQDHLARHRGGAGRGGRGRPGRRGPRGDRRAQGLERTWSGMPARGAGKYLFRIARIIQERARELAVLESLDNGKPIRESRDVDIPLVAAHFFYHAGWADKLEYAGYGPAPRPLGVAGQVIPWNFPLLMLAWKIAPALACGNTVVLKPAETTPLTALTFAEICQQADLPPGVVNIVTGAGETGRALVTHPGIDKVAFTGSTEVGKEIARACAADAQEGDPGAGRQGRQHRVRGRAHRPGGRGHRERHLLQPGPRVLRGLPAARPGVGLRPGVASLQRRLATLRLGDPLDKNTDVGAINSAAQLAKIRELSESGRPRARSAGRRRASCRSRASGSRRRCSPGCRRRIASPARRSSARCCRC